VVIMVTTQQTQQTKTTTRYCPATCAAKPRSACNEDKVFAHLPTLAVDCGIVWDTVEEVGMIVDR
jgi:hypothetical protein